MTPTTPQQHSSNAVNIHEGNNWPPSGLTQEQEDIFIQFLLLFGNNMHGLRLCQVNPGRYWKLYWGSLHVWEKVWIARACDVPLGLRVQERWDAMTIEARALIEKRTQGMAGKAVYLIGKWRAEVPA